MIDSLYSYVDICYIRDTVEAILKILYNEIIFVRIKASWALANITDVLVLNVWVDLTFGKINSNS